MPTRAKNDQASSRPDKETGSTDLHKLFEHTLKDTYFAENAIIKALPKMAKAAQSQDLRKAFETHLKQTEGHVKRLDKVFSMIGEKAAGVPCEAIKGIIKEGEEVMEEFEDTGALDAGLAASAQAVEHYEITRYGTLKAWANELGMEDAAELLDATLKEEVETDELLTQISEKKLIAEAM